MDLQVVRKWTSEDEAIFMPFLLMKPSSGHRIYAVFWVKNQQSFYVDDSIINSVLMAISPQKFFKEFIVFKTVAVWKKADVD